MQIPTTTVRPQATLATETQHTPTHSRDTLHPFKVEAMTSPPSQSNLTATINQSINQPRQCCKHHHHHHHHHRHRHLGTDESRAGRPATYSECLIIGRNGESPPGDGHRLAEGKLPNKTISSILRTDLICIYNEK